MAISADYQEISSISEDSYKIQWMYRGEHKNAPSPNRMLFDGLNGLKYEEMYAGSVSHIQDLLLPVEWKTAAATRYSHINNLKIFRDRLTHISQHGIAETEPIHFSFEGKLITLPKELDYIVAGVEKSRELLELAPDWDDEGGKVISPRLWGLAAGFLLIYSKWLYENLSTLIEVPVISAVPDGSIDIMWHKKNARMLINISALEEPVASYYKDNYTENMSMNGRIPIDKVYDFFAHLITDFVAKK